MKIFFVGVFRFQKHLWDFLPVEKHDHYLLSYATEFYKKPKEKIIEYFEKIPKNAKILLDSGAFSIYTGSANFELDTYIQFLHDFGDKFWRYVELDVIRKGDMSVEESIKLTIQNQKEMEKQGLNPLPVYHAVSSTFSYLEELLQKYDYVFVGGMTAQGINSKKLNELLTGVFNINAKYGRKLHGLGQTNGDVCLKYPFYSVDSISWKSGSMYNRLAFIENYFNQKFYFADKHLYQKKFVNPLIFDEDTLEIMTNANDKDIHNFLEFHKWEEQLTDLWRFRGINYED